MSFTGIRATYRLGLGRALDSSLTLVHRFHPSLLGFGNQLHPTGLHQPALTLSHRTSKSLTDALMTHPCVPAVRCWWV